MSVYGGAGNDALYGKAGSNDSLFGGTGDDSLYGNAGGDFLFGGAGNDDLYGGAGDDFLFGGPGNDSLSGGRGDDILYSSVGADRLIGGEGSDTFEFASRLAGGPGPDQIVDFRSAEDGIQLHQFAFGFDFDRGSLSENDFFAGSGADAGVQGTDNALVYDTDNGGLFFDANGQAAAGRTLIATLAGAPELSADDFLITA
jgi:Ca2+-binding RTX toxin-like protein